MLSEEMNARMTQVGPRTPMGNLLRYYWWPIAVSSELGRLPIRRRLLGEDIVLYRLRDGSIGVIQARCPHRFASFEYGIITADGIRCPYHGWLFDKAGACLDQPAEPPESTFKDRIRVSAYRAEELGGFIHVYMGPDPAPLLPRFDVYVWDNVIREIWLAELNCSWLAAMENSVDPHHTEWVHAQLGHFLNSVDNADMPVDTILKKHQKVGFDEFEWGIIKRRIVEGGSELDDDWKIGHPIIFPNMLRRGFAWLQQFQIRVPIDDEHTRHYTYTVYKPPAGFVLDEQQPETEIPYMLTPFRTEDGRHRVDFIDGQDYMAWETSGPILDRPHEHLGKSDVGLILLRRMFQREMDKVAAGEDPMCVVRDPAKNEIIEIETERSRYGTPDYWKTTLFQNTHRFSPLTPKILDLFGQFDKFEKSAG